MRNLFRDGVLRAGATVLGVALIVGAVAGGVHDISIRRSHAEATAREQQRWLSQPDRDPHSAAHFGQTVFHQRGALSAIDVGVDPYVGVSVFLEAHRRNHPSFPWAAEAARVPGAGIFTVTTALRLLLPLLLIVLAHGTIAGERERGTAAMLLATGVRPVAIVAGKVIGLAGIAILLILPAVLVGGATVAMLTSVRDADLAMRGAAMSLAYGVYAFTFVLVSVGVSAWCRSTTSALGVLLAFWTLSSLVAPRVAADLAAQVHAAPSRIQFQETLDADRPAFVPGAFDAFTQALVTEYGVSSEAELPVNPSGVWLARAEARDSERFARHFSGLDRAYASATRFHAYASIVSPTLALDGVSMALAGSDLAHHRHFLSEAEHHRTVLVSVLNDDLARHPVGRGEVYRAGFDVWQAVPTFSYAPPRLPWALATNPAAVIALVVWLVAAGLLAASAVVSLSRRLADGR